MNARFARWMRFIPAPAGNAQDGRLAVVINAVHPRACGERLN